MAADYTAPSSILIVGGGVFGLSAAFELTKRPHFSDTKITLLDAFNDADTSAAAQTNGTPLETSPSSASAEPASYDVNRIVRADYPYEIYSKLAREAQELWRGEDWGANGRYSECGLLLTANGGTSGDKYVAESLKMVREGGIAAQELNSPEEINAAMRAEGLVKGSGVKGYLNQCSGWADASATMRWLRAKVLATKRVQFVHGEAASLVFKEQGGDVSGVRLVNGEKLLAELTFLATGAWTGRFVDLRGIASARGQCMMYVPVEASDDAKLQDIPVHLNLSLGCFFFPPKNGEVKVARHAYGYAHSVAVAECNPHGLLQTSDRSVSPQTLVSLPAFPPAIPPSDAHVLADFLRTSAPCIDSQVLARGLHSRMCWYLDTASGDFIVCHPPFWNGSTLEPCKGLFLATGGSGHAFKFLPVLGSKLVDVLDGTDARDNGGVFTKRWSWPKRLDEDEVCCFDGSRGGEPGLVLSEALG